MKITLLTGFLGSGKTTALRRILRAAAASGTEIGIIVSDLSELEVDGELIRIGDHVSEREGTLASFTGGPLETLHRRAFLDTLGQMRRRGLRHVIIEASGSADPTALIELIARDPQVQKRVVVSMVDARGLAADFDGGQALLGHDADGPPLARLLLRQLQAADIIALSKSDLVADTVLEHILGCMARIQPGAALTLSVHGQLDERLLEKHSLSPLPDSRIQEAPLTPESCDIGNTVIRDPRPFHPQRFHDLYQHRLGLGIFRTKGFLWFASRPSDVLLWNQAGGTMGLEYLGTWRAAVLSDPQLLAEERELLERQLATAHPIFGDRSCELTVIGTARDREVFCREMQACFCTTDEIAAWQMGKSFPDPWSRALRPVT